MANVKKHPVPKGWTLVTKDEESGTKIQYYTNVVGQQFYTYEDLKRNIKDAKKRGLSIYSPDFNASDFLEPSKSQKGKRAKTEKSSQRQNKKAKLEKASPSKHEENIPSWTIKGKPKKRSKRTVFTTIMKQSEIEKMPKVQSVPHLSCQGKFPQTSPLRAEALPESRASRRIAGLKPELSNDLKFNRALEYVIQDKPRKP